MGCVTAALDVRDVHYRVNKQGGGGVKTSWGEQEKEELKEEEESEAQM